jgi:PhoPQ-activated pathogenicity-related protein
LAWYRTMLTRFQFGIHGVVRVVVLTFLWSLCGGSGSVPRAAAGALEDYIRKEDNRFAWKILETTPVEGGTAYHLELVSQQWREHVWTHHLRVVRPEPVRNRDIAFLFITGDGSGSKTISLLQTLADRSGALAASLTQVPNQPLYGDRKEDALIAYTFDQFAQTGDPTWPLLFPMVKSAVRAMNAVQELAAQKERLEIRRFVVGGASKRGWTTWLTAAADRRVVAIAPMVIDMLNMKTQIEWAEKVYGRQSEQIHDYTDIQLHLRMDEPAIVRLRSLVDPYHYRDRYTMPKLILLGTNDPYWTVDSLRHYWSDLPEPKLIFQTPNAGHDLAGGEQATQTLAAFFQMIADRKELPKMNWQFQPGSERDVQLSVQCSQPARTIRLWTADSSDRDFREDTWQSQPLKVESGSSRAKTTVQTPTTGYRAYLVEMELTSPTGHAYRLSTEARVTPDTAP